MFTRSLQDSYTAFITSPDELLKANLATLFRADGGGGAGDGSGDTGGGDGGGDGNSPPDGDPPADPPADDDLGDDLDNIDKDKLAKLIADRKEKNRRIQERDVRLKDLEKRLADAKKAQAKLDEIERANMSEAEKLKADNEKLQAKLAEAQKDRERSDRMRLLDRHRVKTEYQDFFELELQKAQAEAGEAFDEKKWFEEQHKTRAAMFADGDADTLATGSGPPRGGNSAPVDKLKQEIKDLSSITTPRQEDRTLLAIKRQELQRLETKHGGSGA